MSGDDLTGKSLRPAVSIAWLIGIGLIAGFLSGLFGVGGGILIVPAVVFLLGFGQRIAAGTSLAAIVPTSLVGVISYAVNGSVDWVSAILLAIGAIAGAQLGSYLLAKLPKRALQWGFIGFILVVVVSLFLIVPSRAAEIDLSVGTIIGLILLGFLTGVLSGLLGIGGGVVVVPMLILLFGASDLIAKGTSLLMMVPTAISGTIGNVRRGNVDLKAAAIIGVAACTTTALGAIVASIVPPSVGNLLFAAFLIVIAIRMVLQALKRP
ncbi:MAG TPA: sulfite exporter TauE/SafE family protein [Plantibacter sp.]|uniref:sulfite exporter TauE/SafE family protein n=1 Tax=unclassified Plantibacter TaxID=2624265 RepID=UPI002C361FCF|nr:sulfite exporter TauE/SafE family protein [Plantibacter sp.]